MPSVLVIAPISRTPVGGIATSSSPWVIEAMLRSSRFSGTVIERTVSAVKPNASASAPIPPTIASLTASSAWRVDASRRARARCSTRSTILSISSSISRMWLLRLLQQGVAGGAVVARVGDAGLTRQIGHGVDFASDGGDDRRIDCGNRLQIGIEPRFGGFGASVASERAA